VFKHQHQFAKQSLLSLLFIISLLVGLGFEPVTPIARFGSVVMAQTAVPQAGNANQLMQQGVESYRSRDFSAAITAWQSALSVYQADRNFQQAAVALENLARAHQALDQTSAELQLWQQAESAYRELGNNLRVGRMLTEQAQTYSRLGQYGKAIDLSASIHLPCRECFRN
jgi:tetratricopeptide (TPR) repeat protein